MLAIKGAPDSGETLGTAEQGSCSDEETPLSHMARGICCPKLGPGSCPHSDVKRSRYSMKDLGRCWEALPNPEEWGL